MEDRVWLEGHLDEIAGWRQAFHRNPELGFEETATAARVAALLRSWGIAVTEGIGGTGLVGVINGARGAGLSVGLRAEMDALPMEEKTALDYRSARRGVFHGCGHDGHTAILLGVARRLSAWRDFAGRIVLVFQPAEETLRGGAAMIADGLFDRFPCDEIYALHNYPLIPPGTVAVKAGIVLAASDRLNVTIDGIGSHGATPHRAVDPILVAAQFVTQVQTVVSRSIDPGEAGLVSLGTIQGGTTHNVIPDRVTLSGIIRSVSETGRETIHRRIREICAGLEQGFGAVIDCGIATDCPATVNDARAAALVARVAGDVVGAGNVRAVFEPIMAAEDFAFMLRERPGAYFLVGQGGQPCHHPEYDFDDGIIPVAGAILLGVVRARLAQG